MSCCNILLIFRDVVESNHVVDDVPGVRLYDDNDLASPDNDQLQLPVAPDAAKHTGSSDDLTGLQ